MDIDFMMIRLVKSQLTIALLKFMTDTAFKIALLYYCEGS